MTEDNLPEFNLFCTATDFPQPNAEQIQKKIPPPLGMTVEHRKSKYKQVQPIRKSPWIIAGIVLFLLFLPVVIRTSDTDPMLSEGFHGNPSWS